MAEPTLRLRLMDEPEDLPTLVEWATAVFGGRLVAQTNPQPDTADSSLAYCYVTVPSPAALPRVSSPDGRDTLRFYLQATPSTAARVVRLLVEACAGGGRSRLVHSLGAWQGSDLYDVTLSFSPTRILREEAVSSW